MKFNVISYLVGEGFKNVFKNKKSTASSLTIMCCAMIIFGIFFILGENISHIMDDIKDSQLIQIWLRSDATAEEIAEFSDELKKIDEINSIHYVSSEENKNKIKEVWKDKPDLLEYVDTFEEVPVLYEVTLTDLSYSKEVKAKLELDFKYIVDDVESSDNTFEMLLNIAKGIRLGSFVLLIICIVIAVFIIANTIRLTVEARKKEIFIMRYVGATNSFIRSPFIVEGIIIGIISGAISIILTGTGYKVLQDLVVELTTFKMLGVALKPFGDMFNLLIIVFLTLGIGVGIIGSSISMRKYLKA